MALWRSTMPCPSGFQSLNTLLPNDIPPLQEILLSSLIYPSSSPADAMTILNTEPGGYVPWMALLFNGWAGFSAIFCHTLGDSLLDSTLGSKAGWLTSASTSPEPVSMTTTAPGRSP